MNTLADLKPPQQEVSAGSSPRQAADPEYRSKAGNVLRASNVYHTAIKLMQFLNGVFRKLSLPLNRKNTSITSSSFRPFARASILLAVVTTALSFLPVSLYAQRPDSTNAGNYIEIGAGIGPSVYRDKATSPLFYQGVSLYGTVNLLKITERKEISLGIAMTPGVNAAQVDEAEVGESLINSVSFSHTRLYRLSNWSDDRWNYMLGVSGIATANLRLNEELRNNSVGIEGFANLMAAFKVSRDLSRLREKHKKLAFVNYRLKPRRRSLSYQLNVGVWNNSLRNGYAYFDHSGVVNNPQVFGDYKVQVFSGMRFSSELNYTLHLTGARNNAVRISYVWDALSTRPGPDAFNMARHIVRFTLLYNTK